MGCCRRSVDVGLTSRERKLSSRRRDSVTDIRVFVVAHTEECLAGTKNEVIQHFHDQCRVKDSIQNLIGGSIAKMYHCLVIN
jgi:hypothetical protein